MNDISLPKWLSTREHLKTQRRYTGRFLEKGTKLILNLFSKFNEKPHPSFAERIDVRVKVLLFILLILSISFLKSLISLLLLFSFSLCISILTKGTFKKIVPILSVSFSFFLLIALPAITNLVVDGKVILTLFYTKGNLLGINIPVTVGITDAGLISVSRLFLRSFSSLLITLFLFSTSGLNRLLRDIPMHSSFKIIFFIMLVNIEKQLKKSCDNFLAAISRSPVSPNFREQKDFTGVTIAKIFQESMKTSEEIYLAMSSRNWNRKMSPCSKIDFSHKEGFSLLCVFVLIIVVILL